MGSLTRPLQMLNLHPQLEKDTVILGKLDLCALLLMNDATYPWFILVPDRKDITEIYQLEKKDQVTLMEESCYLSSGLAKAFKADKLNMAALGNIVPQLHLHHIVRYKNDPAWPAPVWGVQPPVKYSDSAIDDIKYTIAAVLKERLSIAG